MKTAINTMRIVVETDLMEKWKKILDERKISQQRAVISLMEWIVGQEPLIQLVIFGQVPAAERRQLSQLVIERLAGNEPKYEKLVGSGISSTVNNLVSADKRKAKK